jgi:NADH:ubiquinone oxidoreductase subunit 3 (subunit A)
MGKTLAIDIGKESIGWAILDDKSNKILNCGVKIFADSSIKTRKTIAKYNIVKIVFITFSISTLLLAIVNYSNWQFWLNNFVTIFLTMYTIISQNNIKNKKL